MYSFKNDYSEGAHSNIINALIKTNMEQTVGYGEDPYCSEATELIKKALNYENVDIHYFVGGTQTNLTTISAFLRPHEAALCAETGHIFTHETGAIEATGHKAFPIHTTDGKLTVEGVKTALEEHVDLHMVKPKLVYISNPTEIGTIYNKKELTALHDFCKKNNLLFYIDGARLASSLTSHENDIKISDYPNLCDAFYIGGTKCGALMGEALVIINDSLKEDFRYNIKQKGGLLAKGRLLGIQFKELFKDDLYEKLGAHSNKTADILRDGIKEAGYDFMIETSTNQVFPIFPNTIIEKLKENYDYTFWCKHDENNSVLRLVTCWATKEEECHNFIKYLKSL